VADISDVEQSLMDAIIGYVFPGGIDTISAVGCPVRIYRGKPTNSALRVDRISGTVDVAIYTASEPSRNTTRWDVQVTELPSTSTLTVGVSGNSATFLGAAEAGDIAGALIDQQVFIYQAQPGDSAALVAAALADAIRTMTICWLTDATITVPGAYDFTARTASSVMALEEWSRQEQGFHVSVLAMTPALRDSVSAGIRQTLAQISFLLLADGTGGRIRFRSEANFDADQAASLYRRDIIYDVEFGVTVLNVNPTMLFADLSWNGTPIYA
jgi:hypothetical protein